MNPSQCLDSQTETIKKAFEPQRLLYEAQTRESHARAAAKVNQKCQCTICENHII